MHKIISCMLSEWPDNLIINNIQWYKLPQACDNTNYTGKRCYAESKHTTYLKHYNSAESSAKEAIKKTCMSIFLMYIWSWYVWAWFFLFSYNITQLLVVSLQGSIIPLFLKSRVCKKEECNKYSFHPKLHVS